MSASLPPGAAKTHLDDAVARLEANWRTGRRRRIVTSGAASVLLAVIVLYGLDRWMTPSRAVRGALLGAAGIFVAAVCARVGRAARPRRDDFARWLALANDREADLVRSAAAFTCDDADDDGESASLRAAVLDQAASATARVPPPRVPPVLVGAVTVLALVLATVVLGDRAAAIVGLERALLLANDAYPTRTRMHLVGHEPGQPIRVVRGRRVRLVARAAGEAATWATLHRHRGDARTRIAMTRDAAGDFVAVLDAVLAAETLHVTGGDDTDRDPMYRLEVVHRPVVVAIDAVEHLPAYTGRPPRSLATGGWSILEGSAVEVSVRTDRPVARARVVLTGGRSPETRSVAMEPTGAATFWVRIEPGGAAQYAVAVADHDGLDNAPPPVHAIRYRADRPPAVAWRGPQVDGLVTPDAVLPIEADVSDDFGVRSAAAVVYPAGAPARGDRRPIARGPRPGPPIAATIAIAERRVRGAVGPRPPEVGDRLSVRIEAEDALGQRGRSTALALEIASPLAVEARLLAEVRETARVIGENVDHLTATEREIARAETRAGAGDLTAGRRIGRLAESASADYTGGLLDAAARLGHLARAHAMNRLPGDAGPALDRVAGEVERGARGLAQLTAGMEPHPEDATVRSRLRAAVRPLDRAREMLTRFADLRDAVRYTARALRRHADVDRTIGAITERAGQGGGIAARLDAAAEGAAEGAAAVRRDIDLAGRALRAVAARPPSPLVPPPERLARWLDGLLGNRVRGLVGQLRDAIEGRRPAIAARPSRELLAHLLALVTEMTEATKARGTRAGPPGERGDPDREDLLERTSAFNRELKDAAEKRERGSAAALERLEERAKRLARDLPHLNTPNGEDEPGVREAHPESMRGMMERVRRSLDRGDADGAVVISDRLLEKLRRWTRRAPSKPGDPELGASRSARPPAPRGQNTGGAYRPESEVAGAARPALPAAREDRGAGLRWGTLPPARGGGTSASVPKDAPARFRRAIEAYYEKLAEAGR